MPVTGHLDVVERDRVAGWARDPGRPLHRVELFLWVDGRLAVRTVANRIRSDLERQAIGDGRHAFQFDRIIPAGTREVRVTTAAGTDLPGSPRRRAAPVAAAAPRQDLPADRDSITILAIARDEGPYIEEWIAYHHAIGVDRFVIYDNASTEWTGERLRGNPAIRELVEVVDWPASRHLPTEGPQLPAYADALPALRRRGGWIAVIDLDEFIVPLVDDGLPALLARFRDVSALSLCWKMFGSSGHASRDDDRLVIDRFGFAGPDRHVKTIARADTIQSITIHAPTLAVGTPVDELRRPIEQSAFSQNPTYRWAQINHYFTKSWEEWTAKRDRGRAGPARGTAGWQRKDELFHTMDVAWEHDLAIRRFRPATLRTLSQLFPERARRVRLTEQPRPAGDEPPSRPASAAPAGSGDGSPDPVLVPVDAHPAGRSAAAVRDDGRGTQKHNPGPQPMSVSDLPHEFWYPEKIAVGPQGNTAICNFLQQTYPPSRHFAYAEFGIWKGDTARRICELFPNATIYLFDFQQNIDAAVAKLAAFPNRVHGYGNSQRYNDSYNWSLMKLIEQQGGAAMFDVCFLDGAHTVAVDALCFFLCDRLLRIGGFMCFDDYHWRSRGSSLDPSKVAPVALQYTEEQIDTYQVRMIVDTLVKRDARYRSVVENVIYQKIA